MSDLTYEDALSREIQSVLWENVWQAARWGRGRITSGVDRDLVPDDGAAVVVREADGKRFLVKVDVELVEL